MRPWQAFRAFNLPPLTANSKPPYPRASSKDHPSQVCYRPEFASKSPNQRSNWWTLTCLAWLHSSTPGGLFHHHHHHNSIHQALSRSPLRYAHRLCSQPANLVPLYWRTSPFTVLQNHGSRLKDGGQRGCQSGQDLIDLHHR